MLIANPPHGAIFSFNTLLLVTVFLENFFKKYPLEPNSTLLDIGTGGGFPAVPIALTYPGVVKTYAIQAGRELRVIVGAEKVSDEQAAQISFDLSKKIQNEMTYPGQIKITVIREIRSINFAR